jgi:hypothetical protein
MCGLVGVRSSLSGRRALRRGVASPGEVAGVVTRLMNLSRCIGPRGERSRDMRTQRHGVVGGAPAVTDRLGHRAVSVIAESVCRHRGGQCLAARR